MYIGMQTALRLTTLTALLSSSTAVFAQSASNPPDPAPSVRSSNLPPAPYAAAERAAATHLGVQEGQAYGGPQAFDRYGGGGSHPRLDARADAPSAPVYTGPRLSWANKTEAAPALRPVMAVPPVNPVQARGPYGQRSAEVYPPNLPAPHKVTPGSQNPPPGWTFVTPIGQNPSKPLVQPTSIYAPAPPMAPQIQSDPQASAASQMSSARHYSVHREYGIEPDPIPLPPQFFGATADMSKPETDEPLRRTVTANGKSQNALQPSDGQ